MTRLLLSTSVLLALSPQLTFAQDFHWTSAPAEAHTQNVYSMWSLAFVWIGLLSVLLASRCFTIIQEYRRRRAGADDASQHQLSKPNRFTSLIKKHLMTAPLFSKRHSKTIVISKRFDLGTVPTRFETLIIATYFGINVLLCTVYIDYTQSVKDTSATVRNRTGVLAVLNMLPLFLFAGRNNPLISLCGINYNTWNLLHRWIGRTVVIEAFAHSLAFLVGDGLAYGWSAVDVYIRDYMKITSGFFAFITFAAIFIQSNVLLRHAFYETFLHVHQALAVIAVALLWVHLRANHPMKSLLITALAVWLADRIYRLLNILYLNYGCTHTRTRAVVEPITGETVKVTLHLPRSFTTKPGQYAFLYLPALGYWMSHPFSIISATTRTPDDSSPRPSIFSSRSPSTEKPDYTTTTTTAVSPTSSHRPSSSSLRPILSSSPDTSQAVSLIVRARGGFTSKLHSHASSAPATTTLASTALLEGPYHSEDFSSYGTALLIAAGVGITHVLPHARALVLGASSSPSAPRPVTRRITLVWLIPSLDHTSWIAPWLREILDAPTAADVLRVRIFVTRDDGFLAERKDEGAGRGALEDLLRHFCVEVVSGKPDVGLVVGEEIGSSIGATVVNVCGTGSLGDEVRCAARGWMTRRNVDFVESSFSW